MRTTRGGRAWALLGACLAVLQLSSVGCHGGGARATQDALVEEPWFTEGNGTDEAAYLDGRPEGEGQLSYEYAEYEGDLIGSEGESSRGNETLDFEDVEGTEGSMPDEVAAEAETAEDPELDEPVDEWEELLGRQERGVSYGSVRYKITDERRKGPSGRRRPATRRPGSRPSPGARPGPAAGGRGGGRGRLRPGAGGRPGRVGEGGHGRVGAGGQGRLGPGRHGRVGAGGQGRVGTGGPGRGGAGGGRIRGGRPSHRKTPAGGSAGSTTPGLDNKKYTDIYKNWRGLVHGK